MSQVESRVHGNLRRVARDGVRHGANAYRSNRDCQETLDQICKWQVPFFVTPPDALQEAVYRYAFTEGWQMAQAAQS